MKIKITDKTVQQIKKILSDYFKGNIDYGVLKRTFPENTDWEEFYLTYFGTRTYTQDEFAEKIVSLKVDKKDYEDLFTGFHI